MTAETRMKRGITLLLSGILVCSMGFSTACSKTTSAAAATEVAASTTATEEIAVDTSGMDFDYTDADLDGTWDDSTATHITLADNAITVDGEGASAAGNTLTISAGGTYILSGTLSDGQVVVAAGADDKLKIVLNAVSVNCETGPAILVSEADKVFVTLAEGTQSYLSDGSSYTLAEGEDEPNAVLFSKVDLTLNGTGGLEIDSSYRNAICSKDDLIITGGTYTLHAAEDALRGRDCVKICAGTFEIEAVGDAIKSNNDEDSTRGFVSVDGGTFDITAGDDGLQAETLLRVTGGDLTIESADDALHSAGQALIQEGSLTISAGDDAIHAETLLTFNGGVLDVSTSYEGLEAEKISINGGTASIVASDDGLNAVTAEADTDTGESTNAAQSTTAAGGPKMGMQGDPMSMSDENCLIEITGGCTVVDASGDGVDSNGAIVVTGGVTLVSGPTSNGDGALDYGLSATISGGVFIATGSTGMAQSFGSDSTQASVVSTVSGSAGELISVCDGNGNVVCSFAPAKSYGMIVASAPGLIEGGSYSLMLGGSANNTDKNGYASSGSISGVTDTVAVTASTASNSSLIMGAAQGGGGMKGAQRPMQP